MKSAYKIRGIYSELKKVFVDKFEDHHLYDVSIRLIDLFEKLNKPLKTRKKSLIFPTDNSRYLSHQPLYKLMQDDEYTVFTKEYDQNYMPINDNIDVNMNKSIVSKWFLENTL